MTKNEDVSWISPKTRKALLKGFTTHELIAELKSRHELCPVVDEMDEPVCMFVTTTDSLIRELKRRDGDAVGVFKIKQHFRIEECSADAFNIPGVGYMSIQWHHVCSGSGPTTIIVVEQ